MKKYIIPLLFVLLIGCGESDPDRKELLITDFAVDNSYHSYENIYPNGYGKPFHASVGEEARVILYIYNQERVVEFKLRLHTCSENLEKGEVRTKQVDYIALSNKDEERIHNSTYVYFFEEGCYTLTFWYISETGRESEALQLDFVVQDPELEQ